ncbi:MAG TPA: SDR family NAD(P)-dependent oxidoreductase [Leptospiraceae bacterium]|jgi:NAD(P)-dependent dehydrogenase (short-subunit alcohol dehydrogenase family)|nr:SDR family NAD(P)-dependent oxidoreductase [Leptospirales bacterium]HMW61653.1 SDR family NAD(P)-dependent oxidoreductase [Leptospiraceae bacterium]HMX56227.1 SDR family NAD(P)-dependent oxidoreductase [Leptospiraceae bacterium]HMY43990.1 SDR family NAD(P)-dependent oxidoreductase [Leptospiraceae bacterium]HMZ35157.1 SDR family NAD(P)-dependent oxidoreductase [Leptospiraceae bacterium]
METVLVTGGASGIGRAIAQEYIAKGARVILADKNRALLQSTARSLGCDWVEMDVTSSSSIKKARANVIKKVGGVDVLVNNAGVVFGGRFEDVSVERHSLTYQVNTLGPVLVTHAFYPDLLSRPGSKIVFVASASGYIGLPRGTTYASSKWSIVGFAESLRAEVEETGRGPSVTLVCPSYVDTGLFAGAKAPLLTPLLHAGDVGRRIVDAAERGRPVLNMPWIVNIIPWIRSVLPRFLYKAILRITGVTRSMDDWHGR